MFSILLSFIHSKNSNLSGTKELSFRQIQPPATKLQFGSRRSAASLRRGLVTPLLILLSGCSTNPIYSTTGAVLSSYAETEATAYVLQTEDTQSACSLGESVEPLIYSFSRVTDAPDIPGAVLLMLAANCAERRAWEEELRYLRAVQTDSVTDAKDARELLKRLNADIASRRYAAFRRAMSAYDYQPLEAESECPILRVDNDEFTFLMGLLAGMQALVNDANSGSKIGVPRNIAPQIERAAQCLNNEKWVGLPQALRVLVWLTIPDTRPSLAPDSWAALKESSQLGIEGGLRIAMALEAVAADSFGRPDILADVLKRFAAAENLFDVNPQYRLADSIAEDVVRFISDKHWTQQYGYRTPGRLFGHLHEPQTSTEIHTIPLNDLR